MHLRDAPHAAGICRRIDEQANKLAKGEWMLGGTWDHELWGGTPLPSHDWVDASTPDTPVFVGRDDGHMAMANTLALRLAGISLPPGKLADVVVLDSDLFSMAPEKIKDAAVRYTIVGGKVVYQAGRS